MGMSKGITQRMIIMIMAVIIAVLVIIIVLFMLTKLSGSGLSSAYTICKFITGPLDKMFNLCERFGTAAIEVGAYG